MFPTALEKLPIFLHQLQLFLRLFLLLMFHLQLFLLDNLILHHRCKLLLLMIFSELNRRQSHLLHLIPQFQHLSFQVQMLHFHLCLVKALVDKLRLQDLRLEDHRDSGLLSMNCLLYRHLWQNLCRWVLLYFRELGWLLHHRLLDRRMDWLHHRRFSRARYLHLLFSQLEWLHPLVVLLAHHHLRLRHSLELP
jgi:hypothetical protein